jgi:hypothetical protein
MGYNRGMVHHIRSLRIPPRSLALLGLVLLNLALIGAWLAPQGGGTPPGLRADADFPELKNFSAGQDFKSLTTYFHDLAEKKGGVYAYQILLRAPLPPNVDLHLLGHEVGDVLYKQEGANGIRACTQDFRNACSHSIVVGLFTDKGEAALPIIADACRNAPGGSGAYTMCFHGLGHGVLAFEGYDMAKAAAICKKTGTAAFKDREYVECIGGTVMEIIGGGFHDRDLWMAQSKKYLDRPDALALCKEKFIPDEARGQCYTYLTPHLFIAAGTNLGSPDPKVFGKAFSFCATLPESDAVNRAACFGGFGKEFVVLAQDRDVRRIDQMNEERMKKVHDWCALANDAKGTVDCSMSALGSIYWGGENDRSAAIRFCTTSPEDLRHQCFGALIGQVSFYISDQSYRRDFCGEIPEAERPACRKRLNVSA